MEDWQKLGAALTAFAGGLVAIWITFRGDRRKDRELDSRLADGDARRKQDAEAAALTLFRSYFKLREGRHDADVAALQRRIDAADREREELRLKLTGEQVHSARQDEELIYLREKLQGLKTKLTNGGVIGPSQSDELDPPGPATGA